MPLRLNKFLAHAGLGSRRGVEVLITEGVVAVNGTVVTGLGTTVDPEKDSVKVRGKRIQLKPHVYAAFHKPKNVVTTLDDPEGRRDLPAVLRGLPAGVKPVGRLDYASEGLLLLTNDGDWAERIQHPSHRVEKAYEVKVKGTPSERTLEMWRRGIPLDGKQARMQQVEVLDRTEAENTWLGVILVQGITRQIRRMCETLGHSVMKLKRVSVGRVRLGDLKPGTWRELTEKEIRSFKEGGTDAQPVFRPPARRPRPAPRPKSRGRAPREGEGRGRGNEQGQGFSSTARRRHPLSGPGIQTGGSHEGPVSHRHPPAVRSGKTGRGARTRARHQRQH
jgi:pseudouridine synthase